MALLFSCASGPGQKLDPQVYYKRTMHLKVNKVERRGVLVVPKASKYKIKAWFPGKGDLVTMKTCHREIEAEKLGTRETFDDFIPSLEMEDDGLCYLEIAAFEHKRGRHSFGIIDFENPKFNLPARVKCSGETYESRGTTICQSREGLTQKITFSEPVYLSPKAKCYDKIANSFSVDKKVLSYKSPNRECTFILQGSSGRLHKLMTIGYEDILIREL